MPQVQVLPYVPSFGESLVETIAKAGPQIASGIKSYRDQQQAQSALGILKDPTKSPMDKVNAFMTLPENLKKSSAPIWAAILGPQAQAQADQQQFQDFKSQNFPAQNPPISPHVQEGTNGAVGTSPEMLPNAQQMIQQATPGGAPLENAATPTPTPKGNIDPNNIATWPDDVLMNLASQNKGPPGKMAEAILKQRQEERKKVTDRESEIFSKNEPHLIKLSDELKDLEIEDSRLARLQELYSDPSKFPNATIASIFSKEGQVNPVAASLLSPEAQEAIKLTIDSLSGAQSTFGGKVSNFEAATYMKRNATLFNTPEGRERILDDLRKLNEMNRKYIDGVMDIIEEKGGSEKISFTSAERLWRKQHKEEIDALRENFIHPQGSNFSAMPEASKYKGRKIENEKTGEVFISDGKTWKKFGE